MGEAIIEIQYFGGRARPCYCNTILKGTLKWGVALASISMGEAITVVAMVPADNVPAISL